MATGVLCFYLIISGLTHQSCLRYFLKQKRWVGLCQHTQTPKSPSLWTLPHTAVPTGHQSSGGCRHRGKVRVTRGHSIIRSTHLYRTTGQRLSIKRYTLTSTPVTLQHTVCANERLLIVLWNRKCISIQLSNRQPTNWVPNKLPIYCISVVFQVYSSLLCHCHSHSLTSLLAVDTAWCHSEGKRRTEPQCNETVTVCGGKLWW